MGNYIPNKPSQSAYMQLIDNSVLTNKKVEIRIRAIGPDGNALAQSEVAELSSECESELVCCFRI